MEPLPDDDPRSVDPTPGAAQWALMALNPSGERQLMVEYLGSGYQGTVLLCRELAGDKLSVLKWSRKAHSKAGMERPDREARVARLLGSSERADRFARLLSSQDMAGGWRTSWWEFYNIGGIQNLSEYIPPRTKPPLSLVCRIVAQGLEGIQHLNELDMRHMDLHVGNVFLHLADGASCPDAVIGDFGYSRLPGEGPPKHTAWDWRRMSSSEKAGHSSPPLAYGPEGTIENRSWRLKWDVDKFLYNVKRELLDGFYEEDEETPLVFSLFKHMSDMIEQDTEDRKLPEAERPPLQDLTQMIQDAKTLERLYADMASDKQALDRLRENLLKDQRRRYLKPRVFDNEWVARNKFREYLDVGLVRVVNLADEKSIEVATAELASLGVEGAAYVADHSDRSGSSPDHSTSPPSSETRESSPVVHPEQQLSEREIAEQQVSENGSAEQQISERDITEQRVSENSSAEQQNPATSSCPSTRWSPSTRGLASATAFAGGDASAVGGLLGVLDLAERAQALVRDEHARRRRWQRLRDLFLRR
ncbi:hypothetical protein INS49_000009 [Diaporthe citri]|uniref:uncharacterized protein n=1 Tax=Diaporthe citri TaxID=83186 RepID=UPI001C81ADF4|nr:uncharacterized protein INS49_000009 [Diaporthe citri]KAG6365833.1 hypothetical protein INS49_000009 [Diaporthe citri]